MSLRDSSDRNLSVGGQPRKRTSFAHRRSSLTSSNHKDVRINDAKTSKDFILEDQVGFLVRAVSQRNTELFSKHMIAGLTRVQFSTMAKLLDVEFSSQNELGRLLLMDRATIRDVVIRLRQRGFIHVQPDKHDRRQHVLGLTKLGQRITRRAMRVAPVITEKMLERLSDNERRQIVKLLRKIVT
jgi:MarR family transcriptional regulator, lower aerobic nicotinate degradation pathway regulator